MLSRLKKAMNPMKCIVVTGFVIAMLLFTAQRVEAQETIDLPYLIKVNRAQNTITIYSKDNKGKYTVPHKAMVCSVGMRNTPTVLGTYNTKGKYRWKELNGKVFGQYSTRIVGGILFHSVYYYKNQNPATLASKQYNKLGEAASQGCIRLTVEDAKWIYDNCPVGTTVTIYDDAKNPGPLGKPVAIKLPTTAKWDPTDPSKENPYKNKKPTINGVKNITIPWGTEVNFKTGVTAKSSVGLDITKDLLVDEEVNIYEPGVYTITYTITDAIGRSSNKKAKVTVEDGALVPSFEGVKDRIFAKDQVVNEELALSFVKVYRGNKEMDSENIHVSIEEIRQNRYHVLYQYRAADDVLLEELAVFVVDNQAPTITGVQDKFISRNSIVDRELFVSGIFIADNLSKLSRDDIILEVSAVTSSGTFSLEEKDNFYYSKVDNIIAYEVTYRIKDEVGNYNEISAVLTYE